MENRHLRHFLAVVDQGGVTRAAEHLRIAQPSLSQSIKGLERELGLPLFHRVGRTMVLSSAGRELLGPARAAVRHMESVHHAAAALNSVEGGDLDLVSMPTPALEPLSSITARFAQLHPNIALRVRSALNDHDVLRTVASGEAEVGLLGGSSTPMAADVDVLALETQPLILVAHPQARLGTSGRPLRAEELAGCDFVASAPGTLTRKVLDDWLASGVAVRVAVETDHRSSVLPLVTAGVGLTILPSAWRSTALRQGLAVHALADVPELSVSLISRRQDLTPAARALVAVARSVTN